MNIFVLFQELFKNFVYSDQSFYISFFYYLFMSTRWRSIPIILNFNLTSQTKSLGKEMNVILVESLKNRINDSFHLIFRKDQRKAGGSM